MAGRWRWCLGVLTLLTLGQPVSLVLCELAMGGVVLVMTCILPMDERFIASPMATHGCFEIRNNWQEWLYFARMKANGGVEVTDVSIENIPQPATVKTWSGWQSASFSERRLR